MKLALAIEQYDPQGGGAERSTAQIAHELISRGHQVTIICARSQNVDDASLTVHCCFTRGRLTGPRMWRFSRWAQTMLQKEAYDATLSVTTAVAAKVVQPRSGTVVETLRQNLAIQTSPLARFGKHLAHQLSVKKQILRRLEAQTLADPKVLRIAANSQYVARQLQEHYNLNGERVVVIPNAAQMPVVSDEERACWRESVRNGYQIQEDEVAFVFAAMNPKLKGLMPLLRAFALYLKRGLPGVLLLAGKIDGYYLRDAARLGIREQIRLVGPTGEMPKLYAAGDVTVLPTFYDPSSKVIIESLMMGVPAISTRFNGASDWLVSEGEPVRGRVIDNPSDWKSLCQAMCELADASQRQQCAEATGGLVETLSMRTHADQLESLFQTL